MECGAWQVTATGATAVLPNLNVRGQRRQVLALFDGAGKDVALKAVRAEAKHGPSHVLAGINQHVQDAGLEASGLVAFLPDDPEVDVAVACVGDVAFYTTTAAGHLQRRGPQDGIGHALDDALGRPTMRGHVFPMNLSDAPVLLCSYTLAKTVDPFLLEQLLQAPEGVRETALELVLDAGHDAGVRGSLALGVRA